MTVRMALYRFGALVTLVLMLAMSSRVLPAQAADSEEISKVLAEAKTHAFEAEHDANLLDTYTRSKIHWEHHALKLDEMREHVNALGRVNKQLADLRDQGSPWQQKAIDQIDPLLREMASNLTNTIKHLNENQSHIHMQPYRDYVHANFTLASQITGMIRDFVDYDEAKSKADASEAKLALAAPEKSE